MITVDGKEFQTVLKVGLSKVKGARCSLSATKKSLTLYFNNETIQYRYKMQAIGESTVEQAFEGALLYKLVQTFKGELQLDVTSSTLYVKHGRSKVSVPTMPPVDTMLDEAPIEKESSTFKGWITNHPLYRAELVKKSLQSIQDNITSSELLVEALWGDNSNTLKIMVTDQFHGLLATVSDKEVYTDKAIRINLPLSSFLLMMDIRGDLYIGHNYVEVKSENARLRCTYLANEGVASIEEFESVGKIKPQIYVDQQDTLDVLKKVIAFSEEDDVVSFHCKKNLFYIGMESTRGSVKEGIECNGSIDECRVSPKNTVDIFAGLSKGKVGLATNQGNLVVFYEALDKNKSVSIVGASVLVANE